MNTVYVVAWEYGELVPGKNYLTGGGGGFDWYFNAADADAAFLKEKVNADDPVLAREYWTAARYDVPVSADPSTDPEAVTHEIDANCLELIDAAPIRYRAAIAKATGGE